MCHLPGDLAQVRVAAYPVKPYPVPHILVSPAAGIDGCDVVRISQRAGAATAAIHPVLADGTVVAAVFPIRKHSKQ